MNTYKIEDHYLMKTIKKLSWHKATRFNGDIEDWVEERLMSREEKIAFVDANWEHGKYWKCPLSVLLEVMNRYQEDVKAGKIKGEWVKRSWDPEPEFILNKNSYKSWARKINKELGEKGFSDRLLSDDSWRDSFGRVYGFDFRLHIWDKVVGRSEFGYSEKYDEGDIVDQVFYELLKELYKQELDHFNSVDPKMVKIAECKKYLNERYPSLSERVWDAVWNDKEDQVSIGELDIVLEAYHLMEKTLKSIEEKAKKELAKFQEYT